MGRKQLLHKNFAAVPEWTRRELEVRDGAGGGADDTVGQVWGRELDDDDTCWARRIFRGRSQHFVITGPCGKWHCPECAQSLVVSLLGSIYRWLDGSPAHVLVAETDEQRRALAADHPRQVWWLRQGDTERSVGILADPHGMRGTTLERKLLDAVFGMAATFHRDVPDDVDAVPRSLTIRVSDEEAEVAFERAGLTVVRYSPNCWGLHGALTDQEWERLAGDLNPYYARGPTLLVA